MVQLYLQVHGIANSVIDLPTNFAYNHIVDQNTAEQFAVEKKALDINNEYYTNQAQTREIQNQINMEKTKRDMLFDKIRRSARRIDEEKNNKND